MRGANIMAGLVFVGAAAALIGYAVRQSSGPEPDRVVPEDLSEVAKAKKSRVKVPITGSPVLGASDAPITLVEFSDFECPYCKRLRPVMKSVFKAYPGKVRLFFRHMPLPAHLRAPRAAEYALAAGEQGKFWPYAEHLFGHQDQLEEADLRRHAEALGLDMAKIDAHLATGSAKGQIRADQELARQLGISGTPVVFINGIKIVGAVPLSNYTAIIDWELETVAELESGGAKPSEIYQTLMRYAQPATPPSRPPDLGARQKIAIEPGTPRLGPASAPVTVIEFSDFQCPFCARIRPALGKISRTYSDSVARYFVHQPLDSHPRAEAAARAAIAADKQGKFWKMHDLLFGNQRALSDDDLRKYAKKVGLDLKRFDVDYKSAETREKLLRDRALAKKHGARSTPTIFVNGRPIRGAQPFLHFKRIVDEELAAAKKKKAGSQ